MNNLGKTIVSYFLQGLVLVVPLATTLYILYALFGIIDDLLPVRLFPGSGILLLFILLTILGFLGNTFIAQPIKAWFKRILNRAPAIKTVYTAITDMINAVVGKRKKFNRPVLVKLTSDSNLMKPGFITQEDLSALGLPEGYVSVYLPHSYNFSGNVFIVETKNVTPIDKKSGEVMKFIVSGGVTDFSEVEEDTSEE